MSGITVPEGPYIAVLIEVVIRFADFFEFSFYIQKNNKEFVKIAIDNSQTLKTMEGYKQRGIKEIYLLESDYNFFTDKIKNHIAERAKNNIQLQDMGPLYEQIKHQLLQIGINGNTLRMAEEFHRSVMSQIIGVPNLTQLLLEFKKNAPDRFDRYIILSYISTSMIEKFSWKSTQIKNKISLASMLCDLKLTEWDFKIMENTPFEDWPATLKEYPLLVAKEIHNADPSIPSEVIQMIEMHREMPDKSGFPNRLQHTSIPLLPSIFIVAYFFTEELAKASLDPEKIDDIMSNIYQKFTRGIFHQASMSIFKTLGCQYPS